MSVGTEVGDFSFTSTSVTVTANDDSTITQQVNLEGGVMGSRTVMGTLTFRAAAAGAERGFVKWSGSSYLDDGTATNGVGRGVFRKSGTNKWRVRVMIQVKGGPLLLSDGEMALEGRTYSGKLYHWE